MSDLVILILAFFSVLLSMYWHQRFLWRLKNEHSRLYEELGEPRTFTKFPLLSKHQIITDLSENKSLTKYANFMRHKKWRELGDSKLTMYAKFRFWTQVFTVVLVVLLLSMARQP